METITPEEYRGTNLQKYSKTNALENETSPYLKQHKDNPVHWLPWNEGVLAMARESNKPILLSIGYSACHWCHVMAHESFENPKTAEIMNALYINIKVDREERPDIDHIYQQALAMTGEQGGWPLTMFLTPDGRPFSGGTYFPPEDRYGRPGFPALLKYMEHVFRTDPDKVESVAGQLTNAVYQQNNKSISVADSKQDDHHDQIIRIMVSNMDMKLGGTFGAPKFPQPLIIRALWLYYLTNSESDLGKDCQNAVEATLRGLCHGGIYDHLAGGFSRYSTDEFWLAPHFEKMLYDNALMIDILTDVWAKTNDGLYKTRVQETINWLGWELKPDEGYAPCFAAALDADSEGEEGKFYVWQEKEIDDVLKDRAAAFKKAFDVTAYGNWENSNILNTSSLIAGKPGKGPVTGFENDKKRLLKARNKRVRPGKDDKILTDWNALVIRALAKAGAVFATPKWITMAEDAYDCIMDKMTESGGRLEHVINGNSQTNRATLDDYANLSSAALMLYQVRGDKKNLDFAEKTVTFIEKNFSGQTANTGYYLTPEDTNDLVIRPKITADNVTPSGNGTMANVFAEMHLLTGQEKYREKAENLIRTLMPENPQLGAQHTMLLTAENRLRQSLQITIIGQAETEADKTLLQQVYAMGLTSGVIIRHNENEALPTSHPAYGKTAIDGKMTVYICQNRVCSEPVTSLDGLQNWKQTENAKH